ncbi:hypothetical protein CTI12_AA301630 [Artemisia annua]|uniref:Uncharacterized protein n=1 Tax=Artemisia annua TaxID=35608 RepID=A0A2U1N5J5_ARTAN|nr:hypothetical protein CTI12_AA301630 [Artemisia annua]
MSHPSTENHDPNIPTLDAINGFHNCTPQISQSNQISFTTNVVPLADINNVSGSSQTTQPIRRRGRPRLSERSIHANNIGVQSNQISSTTNVGPLADITNVSGSSQTTQPIRRRGRPRLSERAIRSNNNEVNQPLQLSLQHLLPQSPLISRFNGTRGLTPSTTIPSRIASNCVSSPLLRRPGRPPLQPNVVPARRNVITRLTRNDDHMNMSTHPTPQVMLSSVTVVDDDGDPVHHTQLSTESNPSFPTTNVVHGLNNSSSTRRARPPLQPNDVTSRRNVRPRLTRNNDHLNMSTQPTPRVMLSSVTVIDDDGNPVHRTQFSRESNPSFPTTNVVRGLNNSTSTCDMSRSTTTQPNDTNVPTSVHRMACQNRRIREYCDSGDATYTSSHCQARYWYGERSVRRSSKSNPRFSTCCSEGKVELPFLRDPSQLLQELMDYNGGERS